MKSQRAEILRFIRRHRLQPATERNLPLFTVSCVAEGYVNVASRFRVAMAALGAIGDRHGVIFLMDEASMVRKFAALLRRRTPIGQQLNEAERGARRAAAAILGSRLPRSPGDALPVLALQYGVYMGHIALFNALWRYVGDRSLQSRFSMAQLRAFGRRRDSVAMLYGRIEVRLRSLARRLARQSGVPADVPRFFTRREILAGKVEALAGRARSVLVARSRGYVYVFERGGPERVLTSPLLIRQLRSALWENRSSQREVRGTPAHPGRVVGTVALLTARNRPSFLAGRIVVTAMTHPKDIPLLRRAAAIVTNEGGVLSHASVVSRELRIPCITSTKVATRVFKDGDRVEVDATKGIVRKI